MPEAQDSTLRKFTVETRRCAGVAVRCASSFPAAAARSARCWRVIFRSGPSRHGAHARPLHRAVANRSLGRRARGPWTETLEGADVCINLAGRSVNCRYTRDNRASIYNSRIRPTRLLDRVIAGARRPAARLAECINGDHLSPCARPRLWTRAPASSAATK